MFFLVDNSYTMGFRFKRIYPNKEPFISQGLAGKPHLGTDLLCIENTGIATLSGQGSYVYGPQGGHQLIFVPNGRNHKIRFLHLKQKPKTGNIRVGDQVFITGNSGAATNAPHLHTDIFDNDIQKYINPEEYDWNEKIMAIYPITIKQKIIINGPVWPTIQQKLDEVRTFYQTFSQGKLDLFFDVSYSNFANIPFRFEPINWSAVIDEQWFDANVLDTNYHITTLVIKDEDLPDNYTDPNGNKLKLLARTFGFTGTIPLKMVIGASENDPNTFPIPMSLFVEAIEHENMHCCKILNVPKNYEYMFDDTHHWFNGPDMGGVRQPEKAFDNLDYDQIYNSLLTQKGEGSMFIQKDGSPTVYLVESGVAIPFGTDFQTFQSFFPNATIVKISTTEFAKLKTGLRITK